MNNVVEQSLPLGKIELDKGLYDFCYYKDELCGIDKSGVVVTFTPVEEYEAIKQVCKAAQPRINCSIGYMSDFYAQNSIPGMAHYSPLLTDTEQTQPSYRDNISLFKLYCKAQMNGSALGTSEIVNGKKTFYDIPLGDSGKHIYGVIGETDTISIAYMSEYRMLLELSDKKCELTSEGKALLREKKPLLSLFNSADRGGGAEELLVKMRKTEIVYTMNDEKEFYNDELACYKYTASDGKVAYKVSDTYERYPSDDVVYIMTEADFVTDKYLSEVVQNIVSLADKNGDHKCGTHYVHYTVTDEGRALAESFEEAVQDEMTRD